MKVQLKSGRRISMVGLRQWPTYYGMLCGRPDPRLNADIIDQALATARELLPGSHPPVLLPPPAGDSLPRIITIGIFDSGELLKPGSEPYSSLAVVWFQEQFAAPAGEAVVRQLEALDWEKLATDWIW